MSLGSVRDRRKFYKEWDKYGPDEFGVEQKDGTFDLSDTQTSFLNEQGLSEEQATAIETQFIDELYGTSEGQTIVDGKNVEHSQGEWQSTYFDDAGAIASGVDTSTWGLDIRRTMVDEDGQTITASHPEYYEHLTRGEVDWQHYVDTFNEDTWKLINQDKSKLLSDEYSDTDKIRWIRQGMHAEANPFEFGDKTELNDHLHWEKYDKDSIFVDKQNNLFIDGEKQPTMKDLWAKGDEGRLTVNKPGEHTAIMKRRQVPRPVIPGVSWDGDTPSLTHKTIIKLSWNIKGLFTGGQPKSEGGKPPTVTQPVTQTGGKD